MSAAAVAAIVERFPDAIVSRHAQCGDETLVVDRRWVVDIARALKTDLGFDMPIDCTGVDYLTYPDRDGPRFEVIYHFYSTTSRERLRVKVQLAEDDAVTPSLRPVYRGFDWFEREVYDMFGITFEDHPDLRRILLYPEFVGHPLRKDYPHRGYQPLVPIARLDPDNEDPKLATTDLNPDMPKSGDSR